MNHFLVRNGIAHFPASGFRSLLSAVAVCAVATGGEIIHDCDFESPDFAPGDLAGQGGWSVLSGTPTIESGTGLSGTQCLSAQSAIFELPVATAEPVVWIDAWHRGPGSAAQPMLPEAPRAAVLFFSATRGLLALDGDGQGNGVFLEIAPSPPADQFSRITLRLDYAAARYDVWVDSTLLRSGLGFKDRSVSSLAAMHFQADATQHLDQLAVTTWALDADTDGDGLNDLDEANNHGTDPTRSDTDADGRNDRAEIIAGTDPLDPGSFFTAGIATATSGDLEISFEAVAERRYTIQSNATLDPGTWTDVPGLENLTGADGETLVVPLPATTSPRQFYRILIEH
jgi:hypothetical protein